LSPELSGKRLQLLKEAFPKVSRVAVFVDATQSLGSWEETQRAAGPLLITPQRIDVREHSDLEPAFSRVKGQRVDALMFLPGPVLTGLRKRIIELTLQSRFPAIYTTEFVDVGGLITYGPNYDDLYRRAAIYVDKILKGTKPADLPVEQPTKFQLVINLKTAKQIGLTIPPNVLARADKVIG
jgi:putative ABC transport system substrate-binding protein